MDVQRRKEWSKKHGRDTYGDDSDEEGIKIKTKGPKGHKKRQVSTEGKCRACGPPLTDGLTTETVKKMRGGDIYSRLEDEQASENSDVIQLSEDSQSDSDGLSLEGYIKARVVIGVYKMTSSDSMSVRVESVEHIRKIAH